MQAQSWRKVLVEPDTSLLQALRILDETSLQILVVVDPERRPLGTVTDGDLRRGILNHLSLDVSVEHLMNRTPVTCGHDTDRLELYERMLALQIRRVPVLDSGGRVAGLIALEELSMPEPLENWAVVMAGGLGTRLRPLTDSVPKPMLPVGPRPIIETTLHHLRFYGFRRVYLAVRYKADIIEDYFGDGKSLGLDIRYLREDKELGTAGALRLIDERPTAPLLVMNGDLLAKVNYRNLLDVHSGSGAKATVCLGEHHYQVPYGVAEFKGNRLVRLVEKPVKRFQVNAGIYVLNPELIDGIPHGRSYDMPTLVDGRIEAGDAVCTYPIFGYWVDIGRLEDLSRAQHLI